MHPIEISTHEDVDMLCSSGTASYKGSADCTSALLSSPHTYLSNALASTEKLEALQSGLPESKSKQVPVLNCGAITSLEHTAGHLQKQALVHGLLHHELGSRIWYQDIS